MNKFMTEKNADAPAARNVVITVGTDRAGINEYIKFFEVNEDVLFTDEEKKIIHQATNQLTDTIHNLRANWRNKLRKIAKSSLVKNPGDLCDALSCIFFLISYDCMMIDTEAMASAGFIPKETVQTMKEAF